tara:strand:+ start:370 stop:1011 length:642 start_codon:yes stop_codon:yes gene_type:complete
MNNYLKTLFGALTITAFTVSSAYSDMGVSLMLGQVETDGTETERTVSGVTSETNSASKSELYYGGSIFVEGDVGPLKVGLDVVPFKIKLGDGKRTDTTSDANESTQEDGTVKAEANLDYLTTIYAHYPLTGDWYAGLGYHMTEVSTDEALHTSSYGDQNLNGFQYAIGKNSGNLRYELSYSDFDSISLTSSNGDKITADADNLMFKLSYVYGN